MPAGHDVEEGTGRLGEMKQGQWVGSMGVVGGDQDSVPRPLCLSDLLLTLDVCGGDTETAVENPWQEQIAQHSWKQPTLVRRDKLIRLVYDDPAHAEALSEPARLLLRFNSSLPARPARTR